MLPFNHNLQKIVAGVILQMAKIVILMIYDATTRPNKNPENFLY